MSAQLGHTRARVRGGGVLRSLRRLLVGFMIVGALGVATASPALADTISIVGNTTGAAATATLVCEFNSQTNTLTFTIPNTSAITQPGSTSTITAIGFDLPPDGNASPSGLNGFAGMQSPSAGSDFAFDDADLGNVPQFNNVVLDFGFVTSSSFSGISVADPLEPGETASFVTSGAAFAGFTESEICNAIYVNFRNVPTTDFSDVGVPGPSDPSNVFGVSDSSLARASAACSFNAQTNTLTFSLRNTSPHDARITAIGFDLPPAGNASKTGLDGFTGNVTQQPTGTSFAFTDAALGNVPGIDGAVLDFGFVTGKNFQGGKANTGLAPSADSDGDATFVVSGAGFAGLTEEQICDSIVLRFQRVGVDGTGGDVALPPSA